MLSKENILSKVSSYDILNRFLQPYHKEGRLLQGKNISNPFFSEKQSTPSFNIFCALPQHEWRYKDFSTDDEGSCFDLVMKLYNIDFSDALHRINDEFSLGLNGKENAAPFKAPVAISIDGNAKPIKVSKRNFTQAELDFWGKYGITITTLCDYKVSALSEFSTNTKEGKTYTIQSSTDKFIFCYDHGHWMKLYKPLDEKQYRFQYLGTKDPGYLFGFDQLPVSADIVFLTGGEKDVLSLSAHGFSAFTLNSETASLSQQLVNDIKQRFKHLLILYDNDETGKIQSEALCRQHNLNRIVLPEMHKGKDISDFFAQGKTVNDVHLLIKSALAEIPPPPEKFVYTAVELLALSNKDPQYLMHPIFPTACTAVLAGKPDTGKSQIARQLCIHVALGIEDFLGFKLTPVHNRSLYVATEDGLNASGFLLRTQLAGLDKKATDNLSFIIADTLDQEEILKLIEEALTKAPCDLVVVDSFGDIFKGGDTNNNMAMRNTVKTFDRIASKYNCLILFVHHINKGAYRQAPGQEHIQGGAGLVQKVRLAIQLTQGEGDIKYFTVVKGNYCPKEYKANAIELEFSEETFLFTPTGKLVPAHKLGDQADKNDGEENQEDLKEVAEEIFSSKILSSTQFCQIFQNVTGKKIASAKRTQKKLKSLGTIIECQGGYRLANLPTNNSIAEDASE